MQQERFIKLIGNKYELVKNKHICIIGLGGVGGYVTEAIARCGVKEITIIDNDCIDITNLNRQIIATHQNIGARKVDEWKKRINLINPEIKVNPIFTFLTQENIDNILSKDMDYIIDACDTINTKKSIIEYCYSNKVKLITSMGTGNKMHPEKFKIIELKKTNYDPIARILRKYVKDKKINSKIMTVCSDEPAYTKIDDCIPSNSFTPGTAGLLIASYIINDIIGDKENE
jgi:tRNA A37 threonylcarbamoyladenosine dehydratase